MSDMTKAIIAFLILIPMTLLLRKFFDKMESPKEPAQPSQEKEKDTRGL